nr:retrotransposon protein, putative, Ty3-gypsy subclass [Tanacetum cinerariifolium]GEZ30579.1 retrotransposon protein, putative, Ty3-gypsy subclass [Tanacetum cinerariifolium]
VQNMKKSKQEEFWVDEHGVIWYGNRLCVPDVSSLREAVLSEDVARFVAKCLTCQQVKIEHQRASGLLQPLDIPTWKWDQISMDFVFGLPRTFKKNDAIWVVIDRLTKSAHFLPIQQGYSVSKLAEIFQQEIIRLHDFGGYVEIMRFKVDGKLGSVFMFKGAPFEILYGRKCRAPICWNEVGEALEFKPGDRVFLKVSPCRGVRRFGFKGKLSPRFIGLFKILDRVGYNYHPYHVVQYPFDKIRKDLSFAEEPEAILDRQERVMRKKTIPLVKVLWKNHPEHEATWENEEMMRTDYPYFFS